VVDAGQGSSFALAQPSDNLWVRLDVIHGMVYGLVSAHVVHNEGVARRGERYGRD
jgi:hypothetical protein